MHANFRISLFGYSRKQVREFIARLSDENESALALRNERFVTLRDENNILKAELADYRRKEQAISASLILAQEMADRVRQSGEQEVQDQKALLMNEIRGLNGLALTLYDRLENAIRQAEDVASGFELELTELKLRKEAFLKSAYPFEPAPASEPKPDSLFIH